MNHLPNLLRLRFRPSISMAKSLEEALLICILKVWAIRQMVVLLMNRWLLSVTLLFGKVHQESRLKSKNIG